ncbi:MAG: uroporphyrinogen decarboxylase family protein [Oscillospiraceae bacterium]
MAAFACPGLENTGSVGERTLGVETAASGEALYRAAKMNAAEAGAPFLKIPLNCNAELSAFGGKTHWNGKEFIPDGYLIDSADALEQIFSVRFSEALFPAVFGCLALKQDGDVFAVCAQGAYSVLSALIEPFTLMRAIRKNRELIDRAVAHLIDFETAFISRAVAQGADIISLADPTGDPEILGMKHYQAFSGLPMYRLLQNILPSLGGACAHLCARTSAAMERCGLLLPSVVPCCGNYGESLVGLSGEAQIKLIGNGCINCADRVVRELTVYRLADATQLEPQTAPLTV